ncbi:MAG: type 1 glutamine amidotransferase [Fibrobacterota bacterium]
MNSPKTIGILQCFHVAENLRPRFGDLFDLFSNLMRPAEHGLVFRKYDVYDGVFPAEAGDCQGYLLTGSPWGVYDTDPSIARLMGFIRECYAQKIPQVGICFGHQALAHALGGRAEKSTRGWGLGVHTFAVNRPMPWMMPPAMEVSLLYSHQDQVTTLPPGAVHLGGDAFCENRMFVIDNLVLGIQGHPEFTMEYYTTAKEAQIEKLEPGFKMKIRGSLKTPMNAEIAGQWMVRFFNAGP